MAARQRDLPSAKLNDIEVGIAHSSPGRLRLRVSKPVIESGVAADAASAFDGQSGVISAKLNNSARSLVVHYDERATNVARLTQGLESAGIRLMIVSDITPSSAPSVHTPLYQWVARKANAADEKLRGASGGSADLRTLVPLSFAALAAREVLSGRSTAVPWYALAWYAFDTFIKLRRPNDMSDPGSG